MYGGPHGPHGPYRPYGYGGPHGPWCGGFHGYGFYGPLPRFSFSGKGEEYIDYMKTLEYEGEGKKYYNACACEKCSKPFAIDYRLAKDVTFVSNGKVGFIDSKFVNDDKVKGCFKFYIDCPECSSNTVFFVDIRRIPKFVRDYYLKETKKVEYRISYKFKNFNAYFDVLYNTCGTTVNDIYNSINSLKLEEVIYSKGSVKSNLNLINNVVLDAYKKKTGIDGFIDTSNIGSSNNIKVSKLRELKYILQSSGIKGLIDYKENSDDDKKEIKLLSR